MTSSLLANFEWNVFIRGMLFPAIMFTILIGSSYAIMATNMGNRLGFLVAAAGLAGWLFLMSIAWMLYGIGLRGKDPTWHVADVITGNKNLNVATNRNVGGIGKLPFETNWCKTDADIAASPETKKALKLPEGIGKARALLAAEKKVEATFQARRTKVKADSGWEPFCVGTGRRGDAQATVDATLVKKKKDPTKTPRALFAEPAEYAAIGAYDQGGDNQLFSVRKHKFFLRHSPHWFVIQVQPYKKEKISEPVLGRNRVQLVDETTGKPAVTVKEEVTKEIDTSQPITTVVMLRDQGSRRKPPFTLFIFSGLMFAILASVLHQRDKQVMGLAAKLPKTKSATA
jgi:hypothetical protein